MRSGIVHDYRIDQGKVVSVRNGSIELLERDGTRQLIPVSADCAGDPQRPLHDARGHSVAPQRHHHQGR